MKKILSILLSFALVFSLLPITAFAAGDSLTLDKTEVKIGEELTVEWKIPNAVSGVKVVQVHVQFDKTKLKVKTFDGTGLAGAVVPTVAEVNNNGYVGLSYSNTSGIDIAAGTVPLKIVFTAIDSGSVTIATDNILLTGGAYGTDDYSGTAGVSPTTATVSVLKSPITSVTIADLDDPVKGGTPDTNVTVTPSGLAANVKWFNGETEVAGPFAASTEYTVKIKLTASGGDNFAETVTAGGYTVTRNSDTELLLAKTFDATTDKALTGLAITSNTIGTKHHGDTIEKSELTVTATYDDGSTDTNFKDYTIVYNGDAANTALKKGNNSITVKADGTNSTPLDVNGVLGQILTEDDFDFKTPNEVTYNPTATAGVSNLLSLTWSAVNRKGDDTTTRDFIHNYVTFEVTDADGTVTTTPTKVGNYTIKFWWKDGPTHEARDKANALTFTGKILSKDISGANINFGTQETYDGTEQSVQIASVKDGTAFLIAAQDYTVFSGNKATDVGNNTLVIKGKGNYTGEARATWTLQQATPVVGDFDTSGLAASYPYTGSEQTAPVPTTDQTGMGTVTVNYPSSTTPKYVGDYGLTFSVAAGQNYTTAGPFPYGTMKIVAVEDPAVITTTASMPKGGHSLDLRTLVSDDAKGDVTFAIAPGATSATLSGYTLTSTGISGTVNITVTIQAKDENGDSKVEYTGKTGTITVTVLDKTTDTGTLKVTQNDITYGETVSPSVTNKPDDTGTVSYTYEGRDGTTYTGGTTAPTDAGKYKVTAECENATTIFKAEDTFEILPKSISDATVDAITGRTYTGIAHTPTPAVKMGSSTTLTSGTDYNLSYSENTNAGTATMTVTGQGNYKDTKIVNFNIGQATLTITGATINAKTYDGTKNATVTGVTFSGLQNSETLTAGTDYNVSGVFNSENVNTANTVTVSVTLNSTTTTKNYTLPTATYNKSATITQAATPAAPTGLTGVKDQMLSTVSLTAHPGWSWANPSQSMNATGSQSFTANYTDPNGNYALGTGISVVVEVSAKADVSGSITFPNGTLTYNGAGQKYEKATTSTTAAGTPVWTYTYAVSGTGALDSAGLPKTAGTYTVTAKYEDDANIGTKNATLTINKATPTGEPKYTKITTSGKTLADAGLTVTGSTLNPNAGTLKWVDDAGAVLPDTTTVAANTSYKWLYTPADTANYNTLTGSIELYHKSSSGGGGGSYSPSYSITVDKTENGTITVSPKSASKGDTVTITVKPDKGYELEMLKALDKDGDALKLTEKNGKYTFKMPSGKVTVKGSFVEEAPVQIFKDVPVDAYYYEAVKWAAEKGITGGVGNGLFAPNQPCTRGQIVTFLWRAAGSPAPKNMSSFTDVPADAFYAKAVAWAVENGITGGTGDGKFSPDATCTRAQSVTFLYRAAGSPKVSSSAEFGDVATNAYYADAVAWAAKNGITGGIGGGLFGSGNDCTRAQIVTFLYRSVK